MSEGLLQQAVAAAKRGRRAEAVTLTKQYIRENPRDARGWWALAKLSDNIEVQKESLKRVLKLQPDHEKARQMMVEIEAKEHALFAFDEPQEEAAPAWMHSALQREDTFDEHYQMDKLHAEAAAEVFKFDGDLAGEPAFAGFGERSGAVPAAAKHTSSGNQFEWIVGIGMILLVLTAIPALGYYAYSYRHMGLFGLLGPDLDKIATTNDFTMRYPGKWQGRIVDNNTSLIAATNNIDTWQQLSTQSLVNTDSLLSGELSSQLETTFGQETVVLVTGPVTPAMMQELNASQGTNYPSFRDYLSASITQVRTDAALLEDISQDGFEFKFDADVQETNIGGEPGTFGFMTMFLKVDRDAIPFGGFIEEINIGVYMAAVNHINQEYVFMLLAFGEKADAHQRTAKRILRTVEFLN
jgi:hypothetical protein